MPIPCVHCDGTGRVRLEGRLVLCIHCRGNGYCDCPECCGHDLVGHLDRDVDVGEPAEQSCLFEDKKDL
jgi:hypothetical protein